MFVRREGHLGCGRGKGDKQEDGSFRNLGFVAAGSSSLIGFSPNRQPWTIDLRERLLWAFWGFILQNLPKNLCRLLVLVPTCTVLWIL